MTDSVSVGCLVINAGSSLFGEVLFTESKDALMFSDQEDLTCYRLNLMELKIWRAVCNARSSLQLAATNRSYRSGSAPGKQTLATIPVRALVLDHVNTP